MMVQTPNGSGSTSGRSARVIGIDLGTTNCCLVACEDSNITVLEVDGYRSTPSYVAFTDTSYLVGREARAQVHVNVSNTIYDAKRLIGRDFADKEVQDDLVNMHWPFLVQANENGRPHYVVRCLGEDMKIMPEMVAQLLLTKMKEAAQAFFGGPLDGAVITVPAYFNDAQRQATKTAALQANINVLHMGILNEPTAAALAYAKQYSDNAEKQVLVFDLGGGTFDVSLVAVEGTVVEVKATDGNNHLGGEDITNNLVRHFLEQIQERYGVDLRDPNQHRSSPRDTPGQLSAAALRAVLRLKIACEDIKCALSDIDGTMKKIDYLWTQMPQFQAVMDRQTFEALNESLFHLCLACTTKVLREAKLEPAGIDYVVLVGGSTRIPRIRELLTGMFGAEKICDKVNPDEVVAYGAGVLAASLSGLADATLLDVTSHSLGVATVGDVLSVVFPKNHSVGSERERPFTTTSDNQSYVRFDIYEGENTKASTNRLLDSFSLQGIPCLPAGKAIVIVKFKVDYDGTLSATATDTTQGGKGSTSRKILKISRKKEEVAVKERAEMTLQSTKLAASKHRVEVGASVLPV